MISISDKIKFIEKICGSGLLSGDGKNLYVSCPFCDAGARKKKLAIKTDDDKWHCWICGKKGINLVPIIKKNKPHLLKDYHHKDISLYEEEEEEKVFLPENFVLLSDNKLKSKDINDVRNYCKQRGLSLNDFWRFRLGTCLKGKFRRRVIIPSFDSEGNLNYYVARSIDERIPKYRNATAHKNDIIFNEINLDWRKPITLVEGPFDLMKCDWNSTCLLGSLLSQKSKLFKKIIENKPEVILGLDHDAIEKTHNIAKTLSYYDCNVRLIKTDNITDIGNITREQFLYLKSKAKPWKSNDRLKLMISSIKSGSII